MLMCNKKLKFNKYVSTLVGPLITKNIYICTYTDDPSDNDNTVKLLKIIAKYEPAIFLIYLCVFELQPHYIFGMELYMHV
jgi:hypothetical protein